MGGVGGEALASDINQIVQIPFSLFKNEPWLIIPASLGLFLLKREWRILGDLQDPALKDRIDFLKRTPLGERYLSSLRNLLDHKYLVRLLGPEDSPKPGSIIDRWLGTQPWTVKSFEFFLFLSFLYPLFFLLVNWVLFNTGQLGQLVIFKPLHGKWSGLKRLALLILLGSEFFFILGYPKKRSLRIVAFVFAGTAATAFTDSHSAVFAGASALGGAGAFAGAFAFVVALAFAGAGRSAFAVTFTFAGAFAFAIVAATAFAGRSTFKVTFAFAGAFAFVVAVAFAGAGGSAFASAIAIVITIIFIFLYFFKFYGYSHERDYLSQFWILGWFSLLLFLLLSSFVVFSLGTNHLSHSIGIITFLGILPLCNAPLDWLSFGTTRGLLRSILVKEHSFFRVIFTSLLDIFLAVIFLVGVILATFGGLKLIEFTAFLAGKEPIFTASQVWDQLLKGSFRVNLWLWITLASTLIPTAFHFLVILLALVTLPFKKTKVEWVVKKYEEALAGKSELHSDARLWAFLIILFAKGLALMLWIALTGYFFYYLFKYLPFLAEKNLERCDSRLQFPTSWLGSDILSI